MDDSQDPLTRQVDDLNCANSSNSNFSCINNNLSHENSNGAVNTTNNKNDESLNSSFNKLVSDEYDELKNNLKKLIEYLNLKDFSVFELNNNHIINNNNKLIKNSAAAAATTTGVTSQASCSKTTTKLDNELKFNKIEDETWITYEKLKQVYSLEGNQNHWISCLLFIAYHKLAVLNKRNYLIDNNNLMNNIKQTTMASNQPYLSLIKLLQHSDCSLENFLKKVKKLIEILNVPRELCFRIEQLELNYNVSCILFNKYKTIFKHLFNCSPTAIWTNLEKFSSTNKLQSNQKSISNANSNNFDSLQRSAKSNKNNLVKINDLFKFGWLLFITIREKYPQISNDLVNSFHLMVCCINLLYLNILNQNTSLKPNKKKHKFTNQQQQQQQRQLAIYLNYLNQIKPEQICTKLTTTTTNEEIINNKIDLNNTNLLIDYLCKQFNGESIETKTINEYYFKPQIKNLIQQGIFLNKMPPLSKVSSVNSPNPDKSSSSSLLSSSNETNHKQEHRIITMKNLINCSNRGRLKLILNNLNKLYESILISNDNLTNNLNLINCLDLVNSFDIDQRLFIHLNNSLNKTNPVELTSNQINTGSPESDIESDNDDSNSERTNDDDHQQTDEQMDTSSLSPLSTSNSSNSTNNEQQTHFNLNLIKLPSSLSSLYLNDLNLNVNLNVNSNDENIWLDKLKSIRKNKLFSENFLSLDETKIKSIESLIRKYSNLFRCSILDKSNLKLEEINKKMKTKKRKLEIDMGPEEENEQIEIEQEQIGPCQLVNNLIELVELFYFRSLETILCTETKRIGSDAFIDNFNKIVQNETFHKCLYVCCFEIIFNFSYLNETSLEKLKYSFNSTAILDLNNNTNNNDLLSIKLENYLSNNSNKFQFPWSINLINLSAFDFFRIIESFIKQNTFTNSQHSSQSISNFPSSTNSLTPREQSQLIYLDREMIRYLNNCEEKILESLAWQKQSPIWSQLNLLKLSENSCNSIILSQQNNSTQFKFAFPLYEDVFLNNPNQLSFNLNSSMTSSSSSSMANSTGSNSQTGLLNSVVSSSSSNNGGELILNLTPNPVTSSAASSLTYSSPIKHPTITRVVCSTNSLGSFSDNVTTTSRSLQLISNQANNNSNSSQSNSTGTKQIQVLTINSSQAKAQINQTSITNSNILNSQTQTNTKSERFINLNNSLIHFFRKFYNLANGRIRELVEKLELVSMLVEMHNNDRILTNELSSSSSTSSSTNTTTTPPNHNNPVMTQIPITPVANSSNQGITSVISCTGNLNSSTNSMSTPAQSQQNQLFNEQQQLILKKIWNIFEYSISCSAGGVGGVGGGIGSGSSEPNLLRERHLDQLIMCCVYVSCKLSSLPIQFSEIMKVYRLTWPQSVNKSHVYRDILLNESNDDLLPSTKQVDHSQTKPSRGDLINFYNEVFIRRVKSYVIQLNNSLANVSPLNAFENKKPSTPIVNNTTISCLSPVSKFPIYNSITQFSPRKVVENQSVFISPGKIINNSCANSLNSSSFQLIQPLQQRNKLVFSLKDPNPNKSIIAINEMIKKNEIKLKPTNKRLFTDTSSSSSSFSSNNLPSTTSTNLSNLTTTSTTSTFTNLNSVPIKQFSSNNEDETDGTNTMVASNNIINSKPTQINAPKITTLSNFNSSFNRPTTSFLSTVVGSRLGSTPSSNLVTMVIGSTSNASALSSLTSTTNTNTNTSATSNSILPVGSNFARKLQNIQSERLN